MAIKELFQDARPQVLFDPRASQRIDPRFKFTRAGAASYYDSKGLLRVLGAPADQPRIGFAYTPDAQGQMVSPGLILEKQSTNLSRDSQDLAISFLQGGSIQSNVAIAPDGTLTADKFVMPTAANPGVGLAVINLGATWVANKPATFSIYAKPAGAHRLGFRIYDGGLDYFAYITFDMNTGQTVPGAKLTGSLNTEKLPNGWWRVSLTGTPVNTYPIYDNYVTVEAHITESTQYPELGTGTEGIFLWGWQFEQSGGPTSYIPTSGADVTRPADLLSIDTDIPSAG